jgi:hypothetical protein
LPQRWRNENPDGSLSMGYTATLKNCRFEFIQLSPVKRIATMPPRRTDGVSHSTLTREEVGTCRGYTAASKKERTADRRRRGTAGKKPVTPSLAPFGEHSNLPTKHRRRTSWPQPSRDTITELTSRDDLVNGHQLVPIDSK